MVLDLNECGLKPRPCEHRCMNSYGSYKCYCLNGYTLMPDGSCTSESYHLCIPHVETQRKSTYMHLYVLICIYMLNMCFFVLLNEDSRTCSLAHCQYGCEEVQGEIRCLCPSAGLQLAQDERTCVGKRPHLCNYVMFFKHRESC